LKNLIDIKNSPVNNVLSILLEDKTAKRNIIFATDSYQNIGSLYSARSEMTTGAVNGMDPFTLQPRTTKDSLDQAARTRKRAEVFTSSWICNRMNNYCDEEWFGCKDVFNSEQDQTWKVVKSRVNFPEGKTWKDYILSRRLEITCGEAPFIVSRYDATTGVLIYPLNHRIGILDRKMRIVNENTDMEEDWMEWTVKAFQSTYGYEFQGDNLLIARVNMLMTFTDYLKERWNRDATIPELKKIANIIAWNFWQMDGYTGTVPFSAKKQNKEQLSMFDDENDIEEEPKMIGCKVYDWVANRSQDYESLKGNN
jgi:hypothetical protein